MSRAPAESAGDGNTVWQLRVFTRDSKNLIEVVTDQRSQLKPAEHSEMRYHDLRHTFATRLVQGGVDSYKVQRLLGHKSPTMTQRYAHHYPESLRDGVAVLDQIAGVGTKLGHSVGSPVAASL